MAVKKYKPTTAGRRRSSVDTFKDVTADKPQKGLTKTNKKKAGRTKGKITVRHRGGGVKRKTRVIDYKRDKFGVPAKVASIEYDPNRGARLALLHYTDGQKSYMIAPVDLQAGETVMVTRERGEIKPGNRMPLKHIPVGVAVYNVEMTPGGGAKMARGAGAMVYVMAVEGKYALLRLPSGEIRKVLKDCLATIGQVSNPDYRLIRWGKAGRTRKKGRRPEVRGKSMNPVDHPHGGGEGRSPVGMKHPKTPQGKPALGVKTRRNKPSDKLIVQRRKKKRK
jgi:large subunit ribosomal protein L2